jgi:hypothetical protein
MQQLHQQQRGQQWRSQLDEQRPALLLLCAPLPGISFTPHASCNKHHPTSRKDPVVCCTAAAAVLLLLYCLSNRHAVVGSRRCCGP